MFRVTSSVKGSSTAVSVSGDKIMSESLIVFQPAIEEPSNIWPSSSFSTLIVCAGTLTCCSFPIVSVKRKSINFTFSSSIIFITFFADIDILLKILLNNKIDRHCQEVCAVANDIASSLRD